MSSRASTNADFVRRFLESDAGLGLQLITSRASGVNTRFVPAVAALLRETKRRVRSTPVDLDARAYALTHVMEAFL
jgi:hypothetical protein